MTQAEKLEALIQKAIDGGWYDDAVEHTFIGNSVHFQMSEISFEMKSFNDIIFNHDFAKALWPGAWGLPDRVSGMEPRAVPKWESHLQQMVIADDPIDYAYKVVFS